MLISQTNRQFQTFFFWGGGQNICENLFYGQEPVTFCPMLHAHLSACHSVGEDQAKAGSAIHQGQLCHLC